MSSKRQKRNAEIKSKKTKKTKRTAILSAIIVISVIFLTVLFIALFDFIYPPATGEQAAKSKKEKAEFTLFFSDAEERFLLPEKRFLPKEDTLEKQAFGIVNALLSGSKTGLINTFPQGVGLNSVQKEGADTLVVDFQESLVKNHPGGSSAEMATVYSLTNTLMANFPEIKKIGILIEGRQRESLKGHIGLAEPFSANKDMISPAPSR
jgi:spore germination protein GerM